MVANTLPPVKKAFSLLVTLVVEVALWRGLSLKVATLP
jgi:hypothetical protein